ncbi:S24 family peptidase [Shewanella sp. 202IG2-18]|uniref:LexA family protein n=1 Tax=Parashewanella hymeniacidonis TaxID=2807618 RepID=UPI00196180A3|nr:S24 family peptidase [Parashewanella hymeniacidonis]MBM7072650.1 S24 family peptidase [Parashewanella hymeniacidonis]
MKIIPIAAQAGITGFESPAAEYSQLPLSLDELLIEHPNATFIGRASGNSMRDVCIFDNDILIVDRHVQSQHLDVIVANLNGEFICKVFDKENQKLLSANGYYQAVTITSFDDFSFEGVVVKSIRCFRPASVLLS